MIRFTHLLPLPLTLVIGLGLVMSSVLAKAQQAPDFSFITNEVLCVLHFVHTAAEGEHSSQSYRAFIEEKTAGDTAFAQLVAEFKSIDFTEGYRRSGLPQRRYRARLVMDFMWMHSAASSDLEDFSQRTFGLLPVQDHAKLEQVLAKAQPYYKRLVWDPQLANIQRTEHFLNAYEDRVAQLFFQVSNFYGTPWPTDIPFTTALCPIPLESGVTSAVPKMNTLICTYLSENDEDYKATLGVAVHEMCHSIYDEQPANLQKQIDDWFMLSKSPFATHAYTYFNEGLATAIGNGWAYEQLNGYVDEGDWYADEMINGFAKAIHPLINAYLRERQTIDRPFVDAAIEAFAKTFPNADRDLNVLFNRVGIYSNSDSEEALTGYTEELFKRFKVSSSFLRAPLTSAAATSSLGYPQLTKLIIVDNDPKENWIRLGNKFEEISAVKRPTSKNFSYTFYDVPSKSTVVLLVVADEGALSQLLEVYKLEPLVELGQSVSLDSRAGE